MSEAGAEPPVPSGWGDSCLAAALFAVDPVGIGGVSLRARAGPVRDRWLALLRALLPESAPMRRVPGHVTDGALLGGLDLAQTLRSGRLIAERGLLAEADGGVVVLSMAERLPARTAATLASVLDSGSVLLQRDGLARVTPTRLGVVALDEGIDADEHPPLALLDRLAFHLGLDGISERDCALSALTRADIAAARTRLGVVRAGDAIVEALCGATMALGIASIRASLLALRVAGAAAALAGRDQVSEADAALAGRLVLAPRATTIPATEQGEAEPGDEAPEQDEGGESADRGDDQSDNAADRPLDDIVLAAARAAIPPDLLARLSLSAAGRSRSGASGRAGAPRSSTRRGRPIGVARGELRNGARLNVVETLRAAAPWQKLRRTVETASDACPARIAVRPDDFRVTRFKARTETTMIFLVDASGSSALNRLAEAKGAVELLLAECYVRRDQVALLAFRGRGADLILPPTSSLARAKRSLAGVPGGGGTPLAAGIDAAAELAYAVSRKGQTPVIILLTDGKANVARDGESGRAQAEADSLAAASNVRAAGFRSILVDTSPRGQKQAEHLASAMDALYLALPYADAATLSRSISAGMAG